MITIREYKKEDIKTLAAIWNEVVEEGVAFPQTEKLSEDEAALLFSKQDVTSVATKDGTICGFYILHPNNVGRCGHICNASYGVASDERGNGVGRLLVEHSLKKAKESGYRIMQFNAVVASNKAAIRIYESVGFRLIGEIPEGFAMKSGGYETIRIYCYVL